MGFVLTLTQPLDLPTTLNGGQCFRWRSYEDGERWTGVIGSNLVRLRLVPGGLAIESAPTPPADLAEAIASYLRLDDDLPAIQARLSKDRHVGEGIDAYPGMRLMRQEPWETLAGFILSSTSNIPRISRTMELIADTFGEPLRLDGAADEGATRDADARSPVTADRVNRKTFPGPAVLAEVGEARLRELGCGFRAPYLWRAAEAVASGELPLDDLRGAPYDVARVALTSLHGVGDKVADCAMLFSLERQEAFPADRWVRRVVVELYGLPENVSYDGVRQWAWDRFGTDAGYANQYLFWQVRESRRGRTAADRAKPREG